jgi:uncharacterized Tic20 family protein
MEKPISDEKVLAALAHASVLFAFFGPVGPTLIWVFQRNKSKYVRFHALQAMGYQALAFWLWFIGIFVVIFGGILVTALVSGFLMENTSSDASFIPFILQPVIFVGMFGLWGLFFIVGIIGAIFCIIDRDFNYPLIGRWLKGKLFGDQITEVETEVWEDNWVSGVCHSTAILQLWGIITPLIVWFSQKERSIKLRFQAMQAILYQLSAFILYMIGMTAYMAVFFMMFAGMAAFGLADPSASTNGELPPVIGIIFIIFLAVIMIFWLLMMIATPIYYILAAVASILTIRGRNFKYPILGGIIAKRMNLPKKEVIPAS